GFNDQWLRLEELADLDKEAMVFPGFKDELRAPLRLETQKLVEEVVWRGDGKLSTILTAPYTFMNAPLAQYYGAKGPTGDAFVQVPVDASRQIGLLGHAGLLAVLGVPDTGLTSLVYRGAFVRERLFCETLPDPPASGPRPARPSPCVARATRPWTRSASGSSTSTPWGCGGRRTGARPSTPAAASRGPTSPVTSTARSSCRGSWRAASRCTTAWPCSGSATAMAAKSRTATPAPSRR